MPNANSIKPTIALPMAQRFRVQRRGPHRIALDIRASSEKSSSMDGGEERRNYWDRARNYWGRI
jgi:hypothetical protein